MIDAQEIFEAFLISEPEGGVEELLARHPARSAELRVLWESYRSTTRLLDATGAHLREDPDDPAPALDEARYEVRYEVRGEIARGGMGRVLEVWDTELRRTLAMKVLRERSVEPAPDGAEILHQARQCSRLLNEAQILGQLEHPGIVPVHEVGRDVAGRPYFTMTRVHGRELGEVFAAVRDGQEGWTLTRALNVLLRVCEAVAHAHAKGVIHRDLKPSNVMVGSYGEVFVMDWGLAKARGREGEVDLRLRTSTVAGTARGGGELQAVSSMSVRTDRRDAAEETLPSPLETLEGDVVGTPSYMAPEQASGQVESMDERCDVYSVGGMLYHLLSGRSPYATAGTSSTPREVLHAVLSGEPEALARTAPQAPAELAAICGRAMARERTARYSSMAALAEDLRAYLEVRVVHAHGTGPWAELRKWMQRRRVVVTLSALLLVVLAGSSVGFGLLYRDASSQHEVAERRLHLLRQNPSGYRIDYSTTPSLETFTEDFEDGRMDRPLRRWVRPEGMEVKNGALVLVRRGPSGSDVSFGLDDSFALMRGDFELTVAFRCRDFVPPSLGMRSTCLAVRRARDGVLVAGVFRGALRNTGWKGFDPAFEGYWAFPAEETVSRGEPWTEPVGRLRITRTGERISTHVWTGRWIELSNEATIAEPVQFFMNLAAEQGDDGVLSLAVDELRFVDGPESAGRQLGPIDASSAFTNDCFLPFGPGGAAGFIEGRLVIDNFLDLRGLSAMDLATPRYALRGDFDVSFRFEVLESTSFEGDSGWFQFEITGASQPPVAVMICNPQARARVEAPRGGETFAYERPSGVIDRLRVTRTGSEVRMQAWDGAWRTVLSVDDAREDLGLLFGAFDPAPHVGLTVAIDELSIEGLYARW